MVNDPLALLIETTQHIFEYCQAEMAENNLSAERRRTLGEAGLTVYEILISLNISQVDKILLEKTLYAIYQILYDEEALFYYSSFYYSYQNVQGELWQAQNHFIKANLDILAMRLKLRLVRMGFAGFGSSTDGYFLSRLDHLTWGIKYVFKREQLDLYIPALYALLNLYQTVIELFDSGIDKDEILTSKLNLVHKLLQTTTSKKDVQEVLQSNPQLRFFLVDQQIHYQNLKNLPIPYNFDSTNINDVSDYDWIPQLYSILSISSHKPNVFVTLCSQLLERWRQHISVMQPRAKILLTSVLTKLLKHSGYENLIEFNIGYRFEEDVNLDEFMPLYFNRYRDIPQMDINPSELDKLYDFSDQELRNRVGNSLTNVDPVVVQREAVKPHGSAEIADMEIPIRLRANAIHYLCMPFKSAPEITQQSVPASYFYQIFRPFIFFTNSIVVFISAKKCSQPLLNMIKQTREKYNLPIGVIENTQLAALLKLNDQL